jgi:hypothetical protein
LSVGRYPTVSMSSSFAGARRNSSQRCNASSANSPRSRSSGTVAVMSAERGALMGRGWNVGSESAEHDRRPCGMSRAICSCNRNRDERVLCRAISPRDAETTYRSELRPASRPFRSTYVTEGEPRARVDSSRPRHPSPCPSRRRHATPRQRSEAVPGFESVSDSGPRTKRM